MVMPIDQAKSEYAQARVFEDEVEWDLIGTLVQEAVREGRKFASIARPISPKNATKLKARGYTVREITYNLVTTQISGW